MRNPRIPLVILIVLTALLAAKTILPRFAKIESPYEKVVAPIDKSVVSKVSIRRNNESMTLTREGDTWMMERERADREKVEDLIQQLTKHEGVQLVSQTEARHKELGVISGEAAEVMLDTTMFLVATPSASGAFVRPSAGNDVYLIPAITSFLLSTTPSYWIDMTMIGYETDQLTSVSVQHTNTLLTLLKKEGKWVFEADGKEVNSEKWDPIAQKISHLVADVTPADELVKDYPKLPSLTLSVTAGTQSETLTFFKGKNDYLVNRKSDGAHLTLTTEKTEEFLLIPSDLI